MKTIVGERVSPRVDHSRGQHALVSPASGGRGGNYSMYANVYYNPAASIGSAI